MKKPQLICALPVEKRPDGLGAPIVPRLSHGVRREDLGAATVRFTIYLLFADGQGDWPIEVNLLSVDGTRSGRPLREVVHLDDPLSVAAVSIDTGIRISRFGYNFISVDLEDETIAQVPFRVYELTDADGVSG